MDVSAITKPAVVEKVVESVETEELTPKVESSENLDTSNKPEIEQPVLKKIKLESSREASAEVDSVDIPSNGPPIHEIVGGSSIRQYLNKHLTKHVLQGLKEVADKKPQDPLIYLGKYLIEQGELMKEQEN